MGFGTGLIDTILERMPEQPDEGVVATTINKLTEQGAFENNPGAHQVTTYPRFVLAKACTWNFYFPNYTPYMYVTTVGIDNNRVICLSSNLRQIGSRFSARWG